MIRYLLVALMLATTALPAAAQSGRGNRAPQSAQQQRQATVRNASEQIITEIYSSSTNDNEWGENRLGERQLARNATHRINYGRTADCTFDFKVIYEDSAVEEHRGVDICRNSTVVFDGSTAERQRGRRGNRSGNSGGEQRSVELTNGFERTIYAAYMANEDSPGDTTTALEWSEDLFGNEMLAPHESLSMNYTGSCVVRLRIVFDNYAAEERSGINICDEQKITVRPGWTTEEEFEANPTQERGANDIGRNSFRLVNRSGEEILIIHANREGIQGDGPDRLGSATLPDGETFTVRVGAIRSDRCLYTVTIVYSSSRPNEARESVNLCETEELVIQDGWDTASAATPRGARAAGGEQPPAAAQSTRNSFRMINRTGEEILIVYANRDGAGRGPDRLGSNTLPNGRNFTVRVGPINPAQCLYTVTIVYAGSRVDERRSGINLCSTEELVIDDNWTTAPMRNQGSIRNGGTLPIVELYVHAPNTPRGDDRLSNGALAIGGIINVPPTDGRCQYHVVGIFRDGREAVATADLCTGEGVTLQ